METKNCNDKNHGRIMIAKKIWVIKMTKQMKCIMRVIIFLNRKQKKKTRRGKKKKAEGR